MEEAMAEEYKRDLRDKMQSFVSNKEKEFQKKQEEFVRREQELRATMETSLRKSISTDFEHKLRMLEGANKDNEEKLRTSRQKELEFLKKEQELANKEAGCPRRSATSKSNASPPGRPSTSCG